MKSLLDVYALAETCCDGIYCYPIKDAEGAAVCLSGYSFIALSKDLLLNSRREREVLRHEIQHIILETWHGVDASEETIARNEYRTRKAEVHYAIPFEELQKAFQDGYTELWQLAEYFDESEAFILDVLKVYQREGLYTAPLSKE